MALIGNPCCSHCGGGALSLRLMTALNELMELLPDGYDLVILSGYRCAAFNNSISNASPRSRHMTGDAIDLFCKDLDVIGLLGIVTQVDAFSEGGIGVYIDRRTEFLHLDVRGYKARFGYRGDNYDKIPWIELEDIFGEEEEE